MSLSCAMCGDPIPLRPYQVDARACSIACASQLYRREHPEQRSLALVEPRAVQEVMRESRLAHEAAVNDDPKDEED